MQPARKTSNPGPTDTQTVPVFAFAPERGDFVELAARRLDADTYELVESLADAADGGFESGDLVRCELSDGELIVQARVFRQRLV